MTRVSRMEKTAAFLVIAALLATLSCCNMSNDNASIAQEPIVVSGGEEHDPIAAIHGLAEEDISRVYCQQKGGRFSFEHPEQYTRLVNDLKKLELLEKIEDYDKNSASISLAYEIELKDAATINLYFYDNVVDFGQGCFYYADADNLLVPEEINLITIGIPEFNMSVGYDAPEDIEGLRSVLTESISTGASVRGADDYSELLCIFFNDWVTENTLLYVKEESGAYYVFKSYLASYVYMGEINQDAYDTLILACKNQYGTREHFSVISGELLIHPLEHFVYDTTYDTQTGEGLVADGFPQLSEWADKLESVLYEPNFALQVKDKHAELRMLLAETHTDITIEEIAALPAGEYIIECFLTTQGEYVEIAGEYNTSTSVYWFKLIKT